MDLEYNKELEDPLPGKKQTLYCSDVGVLLCMMQYSRLDTLNRMRELFSFMQEASRECYKAQICAMNYIISTKELDFTFKPNRPNSWDEKKESRTSVVMENRIPSLESTVVKEV